MKVVLYSHKYEPITILDVDVSLLKYIERHRYYRIAIHNPYQVSCDDSNAVIDLNTRELLVGCKPLRHDDNDQRDWILYLPHKADSDYVIDIYKEPARSDVYYKNPHQFKERNNFIRSMSMKYDLITTIY